MTRASINIQASFLDKLTLKSGCMSHISAPQCEEDVRWFRYGIIRGQKVIIQKLPLRYGRYRCLQTDHYISQPLWFSWEKTLEEFNELLHRDTVSAFLHSKIESSFLCLDFNGLPRKNREKIKALIFF